eukprot:6208102-Pleurochrysis_carterae.AAC.3
MDAGSERERESVRWCGRGRRRGRSRRRGLPCMQRVHATRACNACMHAAAACVCTASACLVLLPKKVDLGAKLVRASLGAAPPTAEGLGKSGEAELPQRAGAGGAHADKRVVQTLYNEAAQRLEHVSCVNGSHRTAGVTRGEI